MIQGCAQPILHLQKGTMALRAPESFEQGDAGRDTETAPSADTILGRHD